MLIRNLVFLSCLIFSISVLMDPTDQTLGLKKYSFILLLCILICGVILEKDRFFSKKDWLIVLMFLLVGVYGSLLAYSSIKFGVSYDYVFTLAYLISFSFIVLLPFCSEPSFERMFKLSLIVAGILLASFTILTWLAFTFFPSNKTLQLFIGFMNYDSKAALITIREFGAFTVTMVYFKGIVLLFPVLAVAMDYYKNVKFKKNIIALVFITSIFLSGTRTNMLLALIMAMFIVYDIVGIKGKRVFILSVTLFTPILLFKLLDLISSNADASYEIKGGDFIGYIDNFISNPSYFYLGDGFGAIMFAQGKSQYVPMTELVYLDLIRWLGFIPALFLLGLLLYPLVIFLQKKEFIYAGAMFCYLIVMGTNPLFISSTGMLAMIIFYSKANNGKLLN